MASNLKTISSAPDKRLTGRQRAFIAAYLGPANYNATLAARLSGYRGNSPHAFQAIGSENLLRPGIRQAVEEHFRMARMSGEEVITELTKLARGSDRDKIKALALLSQHHGLLNGASATNLSPEFVQRMVDSFIRSLQVHIPDPELIEKIVASADQMAGTTPADLAKPIVMQQRERGEVTKVEEHHRSQPATTDLPPTVEVEIIPPSRRLGAAPVERLLAEVESELPPPSLPKCRHGNAAGDCRVVDNKGVCPHWYQQTNQSSQSTLNP